MGLAELISSYRADRKIRKLIRGAREKTLADLRENTFVRVTGTVQPHRARVLEAPLSGRLCAYYSIVIRAPVRSYTLSMRRDRLTYATVGEEQEGVTFELDVDGARAVIDPTDAWISSGFDHKRQLGDDTDGRTSVLWQRHTRTTPTPDARIEEAVLAIGEKIAVFGAAMQEPDRAPAVGEHGYRDGGALRWRFSGTAKFPLVIRDDLRTL